jgi:DNA polymerase III gamma/tau subunit
VEVDRLIQLSSRFSEEDLVRLFHLLAQTEKEIKDSPHPRFQLEIGLVKLTHATRMRTLDELITRLEALESRLNSGGGGGSSNKPYFDRTEPDDLYESETGPSPGQPATNETRTESSAVSVTAGREIEAILKEIQKMNRGLVLTALEDAQGLEYRDGVLAVTFGNDNVLAKRVRDSGQFFSEIGERLFGQPLKLEVRISGEVEERIDEAELKRRSERERAMQNPAVRLIMEKTRAELLWVREKDVL